MRYHNDIGGINIYRFLRKSVCSLARSSYRLISQAVSLRELSTKERTLTRCWCTQGEREDLCVTQRVIVETWAGESGGWGGNPPGFPSEVRRDCARGRKGTAFWICPRFALLIRQRCMLMPANTVRVLYFQMSTADVPGFARRRSRGWM